MIEKKYLNFSKLRTSNDELYDIIVAIKTIGDVVNELTDTLNKLTKEEEYKEGNENDYTKPDTKKLDPISIYKAKLKERIKNDLEGDRSLVRAEVYERVLDLIEKE